jgi:hypothetical protein
MKGIPISLHPNRFAGILLAGALWTAAFPALAALNAPRCAPAPAIDGQLDDAAWAAVEWQGGQFTELNRPDRVVDVQTRFKILHDAENLYIAVKLDEPKMASLRCLETERDGRVYTDDCVEIFLDANGDKSTLFQFVVNSAGVVYDSEVRQGGHVHSSLWNAAGLRVATVQAADHWTVELAVPFVALNLDSGSKGAWGFNMGRERYAGDAQELSSFTPLTGSFLQPSMFSQLTLTGADLSAYLWDVKPPFDIRARAQNGVPTLEVKTFIANRTGAFRFLKLTAALDTQGGGRNEKTVGLDDGQGTDLEFAIPAGANGPAKLSLEIADRRSGQVLATRVFPVTVNYSPLAIQITSPSYRNDIFATQELKEITGRVAVRVDAARMVGRQLRIALLAEDGQAAAECKLAVAADVDFSLPVAKIADGTYRLRCEMLDALGTVEHQSTVPIRKLAPSENEVRLDENLILHVNGKPFLAWGWYSVRESDLPRMGKLGYNVVVDYNAYYRSDVQLKAWFDQVHAAGMKALINPYPTRNLGVDAENKERAGQPLSPEDATAIRGFVHRWKDHPALLAWYIADEPELVPVLPARLEAIHDLCADEDPYHPTVMLNDSIGGIQTYINAGDIMLPDPYPLFIQGGNAASPIEKVSQFIAAIREASQGARARRGAWVCPQIFNYGDYGAENNRQPDFAEMRNMFYQAIAEGASGAACYTYYQAVNYPEMMRGMHFLVQEARRLEPMILAPHRSQRLTSSAPAGLFLADYRKVGDREYVIAVNLSPKAVDAVTITLPEGAATTWQVFSEARAVTAVDGKLTDSFGRYAVHVYTTDADAARSLSLAKAQAEVDKILADLARGKSGNLASYVCGVTVKAISGEPAKYPKALWHVLDGVPVGGGWDPVSYTTGEWLELAFPKPVLIGRVGVISENIAEAVAQVPDGQGGWREVGTLRGEPGQENLTVSFEPVQTSALRIAVKAAKPATDIMVSKGILEIEAYEK